MRQGTRSTPRSVYLLYISATALFKLRRLPESLQRFDKLLAVQPDHLVAINERGSVLAEMKEYDQALAAFQKAVTLNPKFGDVHLNLGNLFGELERHEEAKSSFEKALALNPRLARAWSGLGIILHKSKLFDEALAAFEKAVALDPHLAEAWLGRGNVFWNLTQYDNALTAYDRALSLSPDLKHATGGRLHAKMHLCDWAKIEGEIQHVLSAVRDRKAVSEPFNLLSIPSSSADQLQCAKSFVSDQRSFSALCREIYSHDRIRVAYLSADFRKHAVAYLVTGLFERHDKSRFEITGISFGPAEDSTLRRRLETAFEHFIDAKDKTDEDIANLIRHHEIDIAVDLMGHTQNSRLGILARRPAPIQVQYIGYAGTLGTDYIDYILADSTVVPEEHRPFFTEQVVWLPDSYLVSDDRRAISPHTPMRHECGLPEDAFVFCSFNNSYKITPVIFELWMRVLRAIPKSVLWLSQANAIATANLRREVERHGVSPQRLIFAPRVSDNADHLARQCQADLFLDTLPYNAHTTASDALWAGVPVLTCLGETFAGRVAASLLKAIGLPELITTSLADYETLALKLAREPPFLAAIKAKLARNRETYPLFDTARFTRNIEAAYVTMWERHRRCVRPEPFAVAPIN